MDFMGFRELEGYVKHILTKKVLFNFPQHDNSWNLNKIVNIITNITKNNIYDFTQVHDFSLG